MHVSPDLDTVTYTLAGAANRRRGWGLRDDTFRCLGALQRYYDSTWFQLGDRDLATHIFRTDALRSGRSLTDVTREITRRFGIEVRVLPMSDQPVRTKITIENGGTLDFQDYLVRRRAQGVVRKIRLAGLGKARPAPGVLDALRRSDAIIIPPSNPFVSILPIVKLPGVRRAIRDSGAPVAAVSPLIGGAPVKGPLDHMLSGTGHQVSSAGVAGLYRGLASIFIFDRTDADQAAHVELQRMRPVLTDTLMKSPAAARKLASLVLDQLTL